MKFGLRDSDFAMLLEVFHRHPEVERVRLYGSRAKGTQRPNSDIDLAVWGDLDGVGIAGIAGELDELPLPYLFDVRLFESIQLQALREHIENVGVEIYSNSSTTSHS